MTSPAAEGCAASVAAGRPPLALACLLVWAAVSGLSAQAVGGGRVPTEREAGLAWEAAAFGRARALYARRLEADPSDRVALHRLALLDGWEGELDDALRRFDQLIALEPTRLDARIERAHVLAWKGSVGSALQAVGEVLRIEPGHRPALEARALFRIWSEEIAASVPPYDDRLALTSERPRTHGVPVRMPIGPRDFRRGVAPYDSAIAANPADTEARLGRAHLLTLAGRLDEALALYGELLDENPANVSARHGRARVLTWAGRSREGEEAWRQTTRAAPADVTGLVGLAENLRWQGRLRAALEALGRAQRNDPLDPEARSHRMWLNVVLGPVLVPSAIGETDSEDNRVVTVDFLGAWHVSPGVATRLTAYDRDLEQGAFEGGAFGTHAEATAVVGSGWTLAAGAGFADSDPPLTVVPEIDPDTRTISLSADAGTPSRMNPGVTVAGRRTVLDRSAVLATRPVTTESVAISGGWRARSSWAIDAAVDAARYEAVESNRRLGAHLGVTRSFGPHWTAGTRLRAFGFRDDTDDGYFDPEFYGLAEASGRWRWRRGSLGLLLEAAPGIQRIGWGSDPTGTVRAAGRASWRFRPGRELSLSGGFSSANLPTFATADPDYRYAAVILSLSWRF